MKAYCLLTEQRETNIIIEKKGIQSILLDNAIRLIRKIKNAFYSIKYKNTKRECVQFQYSNQNLFAGLILNKNDETISTSLKHNPILQ